MKRLWEAALLIALPQNPFRKWSVRGLIRVLVFTIVLCPLFALYMFGLFVSPGIALWRLVQRDYGDMARDRSKDNLKPALVVLYSLALLQGVLFYYRAISSFEEHRLLKLVARAYDLEEHDKARLSIADYLREIRVGCEKDPSFARGKNLVTYAAGLMQSSSPERYLSGARIIDTLIQLPESMKENERKLIGMVGSAASSGGGNDAVARNLVRFIRTRVPESVVHSQRMLMSNMIGSASSGVIKKFVQMLYSQNQSDSKEIRSRAMRIVAHFASEIRLSKIPYAIQCVSSFLDSTEESHQHKEKSIHILWKLTDDEENLRLMSNRNDLALKIIKMLLDSDDGELHNSHHDSWCVKIAEPGMEVIKRFTSVMKRSNNMQLAREILESTHAISTLERMLECQKCKVEEELQKSVIMVLTQITSMGTSFLVDDGVKKRFIDSLINIFPDGSDHTSSVKKLAGESLEQLSHVKENSAIILEAEDGRIVDSLTQVIVQKDSEYRKSAADILKHLCSHCTTDDGHGFEKLKDAMIDVVIPEVLTEVLNSSLLFLPFLNSYDNVVKLEALSSLCATVHVRLTSQDPGLTTRFDQKAEQICNAMEEEVMTFADLLRKAADVVARQRRSWTYQDENPNACCIS